MAADATWSSDGGGKVTAARRPVEGREKVSRFLVGLFQRFAAGMRFTTAEINGEPAVAAWAGEALLGVVALELPEGLVVHARAVVNPDKLAFADRQPAGA
ncbi:hypothetical protein [Streptomyces sp. ISL-22]|uniref:hypothetical protein n=1 Tax=Streptomyces sp. ISL-22 TaxID=2819180 RepID=UPI002035C077|nr:hypothetical protein [Streptomyces sp. ISL-22]